MDCDIVVKDGNELKKIGVIIQKIGSKKTGNVEAAQYSGSFARYEKKLENNFAVCIDILIHKITDRMTSSIFTADWIFKNSSIRMLKGKTIPEELKLRIINPDALVAMKIVSCRNADIRDVFMLMPQAKNSEWVKKEVSERCNFKDKFLRIKEKITSAQFKDNLQGVHGHVDRNLFEKHEKAVLGIG